jgi:hypothetical protein
VEEFVPIFNELAHKWDKGTLCPSMIASQVRTPDFKGFIAQFMEKNSDYVNLMKDPKVLVAKQLCAIAKSVLTPAGKQAYAALDALVRGLNS